MTKEEREIRVIIDNARLSMSWANREHFDIEASDHLEYLQCNPSESGIITRSIMHRAHLHQTRNMFRVPPMLIKRDDETDAQHETREQESWGIYPVGDCTENIRNNNNNHNNKSRRMKTVLKALDELYATCRPKEL